MHSKKKLKKCLFSTNLSSISLDVIRLINSFLDLKSFLCLASSCSRFHNLQIYDGRNFEFIAVEFRRLLRTVDCTTADDILVNIIGKRIIIVSDCYHFDPKYAIIAGHYKYFKLLLNHKQFLTSDLEYFLIESAVHRRIQFCEYLCQDMNVDVNCLSYLSIDCCTGSPLMNAVVAGNLALVKYFLAHGANPNLRSRHSSPLGMACSQLRMELVEVLVEGGADVNLADQFNQLPLLYCRKVQFVEYLVSKGANVHILDLNSRSLLHHAASRRYFNIYKRLLDLKVDSLQSLSNGWKAIDIALKASGKFPYTAPSYQINLKREQFLKMERDIIEKLIDEGQSDD